LGILEQGLEDAIAVLTLPEKYQRRLRTTNMVERVNRKSAALKRWFASFPSKMPRIDRNA